MFNNISVYTLLFLLWIK